MIWCKGELSAGTVSRDWPHQVALPANQLKRRIGADCSVVVKCPGSAGGRSSPLHRVNRQREEPDNQRKAAAFVRWHEPDESRGSRADL